MELIDAENHGELKYLASVVCDDDKIIRDSLSKKGKRVITFASILKFQTFPLAELLKEMLVLGETAMGCPVELEYAVNINDDPDINDEFCLLQILRTAGFQRHNK